MIIDELNKKIADIESLANDKTSTIESKVSDLTEGLLMVADAVDIIPEMVDEKITAITKEFSTIKDTVSKVKAKKGDKGDRGEPGIDGIGIKGDDGKDGSPDTGEQIVDKINELEGVLDTKVLKDFSMPDVKDLERQINTIGNQTLRLLSRPTTTTSSSFTGVTTDATLTGLGTDTSPLSVVSTSASDVAITVRAATTAALAGSPTYDNGISGVGATLTRGTNGILPNQDGRTLQVADRLLVKNQSSTLQNGVYEVTSLGSVSTPWVLTRTTDADTTSQLDELVVTVSEGSTNRGTVWGQQTNNPVVGTSAITFATVVSTAVTQATSGTQVINQIPLYTGTARQLTRGTANFKYNPTNDLFTIRGIDYTFPANNGDASQVLTTDGSGNLSWETGGGGTPGGSNRSIQFNTSGAFDGGDDLTWDSERKRFYAGDITETQNHTYQILDDSGSLFYVNGLKNTVPASTTTPVFTGSGLDDLSTSGAFTGLIGISYTVTVSATGTPDSFDWTDTNGGSGTNVPMSTSPTLLSNGIEVVFGADTGHTLTDNWTFDGVPASTTYGKMLNLDGANQEFSFGDVDGISDSAKLKITGGDKPEYVNYFNDNGDFRVVGSLNSQEYLTIGGNSGSSAAEFKLDDHFSIFDSSGNQYFYLNKADGEYTIGQNGVGDSNVSISNSSGIVFIQSQNQIGALVADSGFYLNGGANDSRTYFTGKIGSTGFSTGLDLRFKENKYSIGDIGTINNGTYLEINDNAKNVNNYTDQFYIRNSASTSNVTFSTDTATLSATIGDVNGTGNNTKITIDDVNEQITISNLPAYDDDTAAGVGGLTAGMVYMTTGSGSAPLNAAGILMIKQ